SNIARLVCHKLEKQANVPALNHEWLVLACCRAAILHLKLPMKTRYIEVSHIHEKIQKSL
ncbi:23S rRNA (cytidine(2498)-2'-O)-methyltransferase RlmM, partial [Plesiomonas shigelloides]|nr:23S rRNA (cytidine(2498)-2'-O)-methyltransferase RlmM [Plesiomonas shigelloides]